MTDRYRVDAVVVDRPGTRLARGVDTVSGETVAIKTITGADRAALDRAVAAAEAWQRVGTTVGVAAVRDLSVDEDVLTVVTDWVDGIDLASLVRSEGQPGLPFARVLQWLREIAEALDRLHAANPPVVHADVKPGNIVVGDDERAVLVDVSGPTSPGTDGFRAPEVAAGSPATPASDRFALAAAAQFLLSGAALRVGEMPDLDLGRHTDAVVEALAAGLAPSPTDRPTTARSFVDALAPPHVTDALPQPGTPFVGRRRQRDDVAAALGTHRLVTLWGPGGVGKTRLALAAAADAAHRFPDGISFASLAGADPASVLVAIATAVGLPGTLDVSAEAIAQHLAGHDALVVLDTCEHVLDSAGAVAAALAGVDGPTVLATSRQALGLDHELACPVSVMTRADAVRLFCQRASSADPTIDLAAPGAAGVVETLISDLDALALAVVLAASRIGDLPLAAIGADAASRTPTLEATIRWSVDLLPAAAATTLAELAAFSGSFSREAAAAVVADEAAVATLVAAALVEEGPSDHFRLLDTVREFGSTHLRHRIDADAVAARHAAYHLARAELAAASLDAGDQAEVLAALVIEHENDRAAFEFFLATDQRDLALRYVIAMFRYWSLAGGAMEGRVWAERALQTTSGVAAETVARAMARAADLLLQCSDHEGARQQADSALTRARAHGDRGATAEAVNVLGTIAASSGRFDEARTLLSEALTLATALGDVRLASVAAGNLGWVEMAANNFPAAQTALSASFENLLALGNEVDAGNVLANKGRIALARGDADVALADLTQALDLLRRTGHRAGVGLVLSYLADVYYARDDATYADASYQEALDINRELGSARGCIGPLLGLARTADALGDARRAMATAAEALSLAREHAGPDAVADVLMMSGKLARRNGRPNDALELLQEARQLSESVQATANVRILEELGAVHELVGDGAAAAEQFRVAAAIRIEQGRQPDPEDEDVRAARDRAFTALGPG